MAETLDYSDDIVVPREEDRGFGALAHLFAAVPIWGLVLNAGMFLHFRERSREVAFHAQQGLWFQGVGLVILIVYLLVEVLLRIVGVLSEPLAHGLHLVNLLMTSICFTAYATCCLAGAALTLAGKPFLYPRLGRRLLEGFWRKSTLGG